MCTLRKQYPGPQPVGSVPPGEGAHPREAAGRSAAGAGIRRGMHITWGVVQIHTRIPKKPWETMNIHDFKSDCSLKIYQILWKINEKS